MSTALTCVSVVTGTPCPARGPVAMVRSPRVRLPAPTTDDDRPEQRDQRGHVVRPHVHERPAAGHVVEVRVRVPALVARGDHGRGREHRRTDEPVVDRLARGLHARPQDGVRGAPDEHPGGPGRVEQLDRLDRRGGERLLAVQVLAGRDHALADLGVRRRDGEVEDDVDLVVGEQLVDAERPHPGPRRRDRLRPGRVPVGDGDQLHRAHPGERVEVLPDDGAAADDADPHRLAHSSPRSTRVRTFGSSRTSTRCPGVQTNTRPSPQAASTPPAR